MHTDIHRHRVLVSRFLQSPIRVAVGSFLLVLSASVQAHLLANDALTPPPPTLTQRLYDSAFPTQDSTPQSLTPTSSSTINLLVLYDPSLNNASQTIHGMVDDTNTYYVNSQIGVILQTAALVPLDAGSGSNSAVLNELTTGSFQSEVGSLRDLYRADMVAYIRPYDGGGSCGTAWVIGSGGSTPNQNTLRTFSVSVTMTGSSGQFFCSDNTLAHELGHNFGAAHNRENAGVPPRFSYGYGEGRAGEFGTIMSLLSPEVNLFSNPHLSNCNGFVCGHPGSEDVARAINEVRDRYSMIYPDPPGPPVITLLNPRVDQTDVAFDAAASGPAATSFSVTCTNALTSTSSSQSGSASPITVGDLAPNASYSCAVVAENAAGAGTESQSVTFDTLPIPAPTIEDLEESDGQVAFSVEIPAVNGGYQIQGTRAQCDDEVIESASGSFVFTGLTNGVTISCSATVLTSVGESAPSPSVSATPELPGGSGSDPGAPPDPDPGAGAGGGPGSGSGGGSPADEEEELILSNMRLLLLIIASEEARKAQEASEN
ncbi:MAG: reprolysin-like metallopeptidase [Pseudomonadota bacterium]